MFREVIAPLVVLDPVNRSRVRLEPGSILAACSIHRNGESSYMMTFQCSGRSLTCPLFQFQPRTRSVELAPAEAVVS